MLALYKDLDQYETMTTEEKEKALDKIAQDLYQGNRMFTPLFPWVFVRVLPKEQVRPSGIILPAKQNKIFHEGIVLAVWKTGVTSHEGHLQVRKSELCPGDHVLFPHWAGLPISGFSEERYRVVKEQEWSTEKEGGIFATVEYASKTDFDTLTDLMSRYDDTELACKIEDRFLLVDREGQSCTISGR